VSLNWAGVPGNRERWTSHLTFKVENPTSLSYPYYCLAANVRWVFLVS
jgi:hypothetical protein